MYFYRFIHQFGWDAFAERKRGMAAHKNPFPFNSFISFTLFFKIIRMLFWMIRTVFALLISPIFFVNYSNHIYGNLYQLELIHKVFDVLIDYK